MFPDSRRVSVGVGLLFTPNGIFRVSTRMRRFIKTFDDEKPVKPAVFCVVAL
jgi:hypothetical protein